MFQQLFKSKNNSSILKLSFGSIISQVIPFLLMPILTRLYSPQEFGGLAIFISITLIFAEIVTGKYEMAILLPKKTLTAIELTTSTIYFNLILSFILFILISIFKTPFLNAFDQDEVLNNWVYLIPIAVFLNALYEILKDFSLRMNSYTIISKSYITRSTFGNTAQLILGILKYTTSGLIVGNLLSQIAANTQVLRIFLQEKKLKNFKKLKFNRFISLLNQYKDFPLYSMPSSVLTTLSNQLLLITLPIIFSSNIAGFYLLAQRIANIPISIISNSIRQVAYKEYSEIQNDVDALRKKTWEILTKAFIIGIIPTIILMFTGQILFRFAFGAQWAMAGVFAQIISIWYLMVFISGPISNLLIVIKKQHKALIFQIISFCLKSLCLYYCYLKHYSILITIITFSIISTILLMVLMVYILNLIKFNFNKLAIYLFTLITVLCFIYLISLL
ncbi:oligosaccharide flippase family protein [Arachidicoccus ginsenosidivorans]|uniref:Oligosaccharide flippase family protein n=1 Tax=Arachidicoccus ginsenosidivorans TaxID=496057 RepID=A0A5B8VR41_9BACT|nr:oligosaccharide flippase family protein [Arachidicoccus ginsenosidivorans]QEC72738.1 oligosaccharide flippase family protein [Arachidicoccus ginsenosidivorans]